MQIVWKLYAGFALVILTTAGIFGFLAGSFIDRVTRDEIDRRLRAEAHLLEREVRIALGSPAGASLMERVAELARATGSRLTVVAADGKVLADSARDPAAMDNHGTRPEILTAFAEGIGAESRFSRTVEQHLRYVALRLEVDGELFGVVRTSIPLTVLDVRGRQLFNLMLLAVAIAAAVALAVGAWLARRLTRPLREMAATAEAIARGAHADSIPVWSRDELGLLARAFNRMSEELRHTTASTRADRNKLTAILSSMVEGVVAVDRDGHIVHMNEVASKLLGVTPEDALSQPLWETIHLRDVTDILSETLRSKSVGHRVVQVPGTQNRFLDVRASPLKASGNVLAGAVLVFDDITRLRQLERMRSDFVGNVSHELKTPVTVIRGLVETLLDDDDIEAAIQQRFLGKIMRQSERLSNLVTDLLSLSRLESEAEPFERAPLDLRDVLEESILVLAPKSDQLGVRVERNWSDESLVVQADEEALRQAISNLLDNAIKYSPRQGLVVVRASRDADSILVEVCDEGPGIEPCHHSRLFERFYRVDAARSRELGGTGLGLAIVKHTALALGGDVSVTSMPGEGSTFRIHLPVAREAPPPAS